MGKSYGDMLRQFEQGRYVFSGFLGLQELDEFYRFIRQYDGIPWELYGGHPDCERVMLRFGSEESLGYEVEYPIALLKIEPKSRKFADALSHRDFLGALMNLGVERDTLGDIYIEDNVGYVFCVDSMAQYIVEQLDRIKHTVVSVERVEELPPLTAREPEEKLIQVASLRLDLVIAHTYNLSRGAAQNLFVAKKVYVNGRLCENNSRELKPDDLISVRGFGRLWLVREGGLSKKGKHNLVVATTK